MSTHSNHRTMSLASCSCMTLTSKTGNHYWFRTCDVETDIWKDGSHGVSVSAGSRLRLNGREEKSKYAYMGMTYNKQDTWLLDGVNEKGLCGGLLMLFEGTSVDKAWGNYEGYMGMEIVTKMLSSCANVEEVIQMAKRIQVLSIPFQGQYVPASIHYFFTDITGNEVILEATDSETPGIFTIYKKEQIIGVMTNSPEYPKHLENLSWYLALSPELKQGIKGNPIRSLILDGRQVKQNSCGEHILKTAVFPASYSSYDRFIRLSVLKALNHCGNRFSDEAMLAMGSGIMNVVNEPNSQGVYHYTRIENGTRVIGQKDSYTQYLIMYDIAERAFYIKPFDMVSWTKYQLSAEKKTDIIKYEISHNSMDGILVGNK